MVTFLAVSACGGAGEPTGDGGYSIPQQSLSGSLNQAGEGERTFLEDGIVTFDEYEQAFFNMVACAEQSGVTIYGVRLTSRNQYHFQSTWPAEQAQEGHDAIEACKRTYFSEVDRMWSRSVVPTEAERQKEIDELAACMREVGVSLPVPASHEDILNYFMTSQVREGPAAECVFAAQDRTGDPLLGGVQRTPVPPPGLSSPTPTASP